MAVLHGYWEKFSGGREQEEKEERGNEEGVMAFSGVSRRPSWPSAASRRWPAAALRRTRSCFQLEEEEKKILQKTP
jgi:hypothetical protein